MTFYSPPRKGIPIADSDSWFVAGWETDQGNWVDVQNGGEPPTPYDLLYSEQTVVGYFDADGIGHYYTLHGGLDVGEDWEYWGDYIEDLEVEYGGEAA